jgi:chaperonin cofactor prefoldin
MTLEDIVISQMSADEKIERLLRLTNPKSKPVHGLFKVPAEVIIQEKDREILKLTQLIGEYKMKILSLELHVSELKKALKEQVNSEEVARASYETKREELYRQIRATNDSLRHRIKVLERSNKDLLNKLIKANKS